MIGRDEIARSLNAAWLLFLDRPNAVRLFDASYQGFWRSFQAIALIVPIYAVTVYAERQAIRTDAMPDEAYSEGAFVAAAWLTLALDWVTLPLLLATLARFLAIRQHYATYIVARNWTSVLAVVPYGVIAVLGLLAPDLGDLLYFLLVIALAVALRFSYQIARRALDVTVDVAIGFVALEVLVGLGLSRIISILLGAEVPA